MKRFYVVTIVMFLLLTLFYSYGIAVDRSEHGTHSAAAEADISLD